MFLAYTFIIFVHVFTLKVYAGRFQVVLFTCTISLVTGFASLMLVLLFCSLRIFSHA